MRHEVTAGDFKYSIERAADPKLAGAQSPRLLPAGIISDDIVGVSDRAGREGDPDNGRAGYPTLIRSC